MKYLDVKYLRLLSPQLSLFTDKGNDLFNFRCPICGDSERDRTRARGYVFPVENKLIFKCHNCGDARGMPGLLRAVDPRLADEYRMEKFEATHGRKRQVLDVEKLITPAPLFQANSPSKVLLALDGVSRLLDLPEDHEARQYMRGRKIDNLNGLFHCADDIVLEKLSPAYERRIRGGASRILLPFTDRTGNMVGLTGRALDPDALRYLHIKIDEDAPLIYGLDKWEPTTYTYVVEGQFDSMFLPNALAVGGSDLVKMTEIIDKHNTVFVFDNEPRNRENIKKMRKLVADGYSVCVWPNRIEQKDINDMVLAGAKPSSVKTVIDLNTASGLTAELAINDWSR